MDSASQENMTADLLNASLIDRQDLNDELCIIRTRLDSGRVPSFEPGQFITIGLPNRSLDRPRWIRRAYSIASSANIRDYLELYVVLVQEGKLTPRIWDLHTGDRIWMDDKAKGHFTLRDIPPDKDLVMISTGTGIAPYMSMLRTYAGQSRWNRFVVIHGARLVVDLGYRHELERISHTDPTVYFIPTVTREPSKSTWQGLRGRVQAAIEKDHYEAAVGATLDPKNCHVFLCGNPDMIRGIQQTLESRGFVTDARRQKGNLHFERYW